MVTTKVGTSDDTGALRGTVLNDGEDKFHACRVYTSDAADVLLVVNLGCRRFP